MEMESSKAPIWSLSDSELARECHLIAESGSKAIEPSLHDEFRRLYEVWQEAEDKPEDRDHERARKAALRAGLRKRTIEILIKLGASKQARAHAHRSAGDSSATRAH